MIELVSLYYTYPILNFVALLNCDYKYERQLCLLLFRNKTRKLSNKNALV